MNCQKNLLTGPEFVDLKENPWMCERLGTYIYRFYKNGGNDPRTQYTLEVQKYIEFEKCSSDYDTVITMSLDTLRYMTVERFNELCRNAKFWASLGGLWGYYFDNYKTGICWDW